jgi:hypothetical protein
MTKHECSAPICALDPNPNFKKEVVWVPGETICTNKPYQKFQEKQIRINELWRRKKYKKVEGLTAEQLES